MKFVTKLFVIQKIPKVTYNFIRVTSGYVFLAFTDFGQ